MATGYQGSTSNNVDVVILIDATLMVLLFLKMHVVDKLEAKFSTKSTETVHFVPRMLIPHRQEGVNNNYAQKSRKESVPPSVSRPALLKVQ